MTGMVPRTGIQSTKYSERRAAQHIPNYSHIECLTDNMFIFRAILQKLFLSVNYSLRLMILDIVKAPLENSHGEDTEFG